MTSLGRIAKATGIAIIVSLICLLPPIVHFVTGPLGPAIGGYIAGTRTRLSHSQSAVLGIVLGVLVGVPAPLAFAQTGLLPAISNVALIAFVILITLYVGVLGGVAAAIGGQSARSDAE